MILLLIPWVPLTKFEGPPEPIFQKCLARFNAEAAPQERENLLAVIQVLASLRYNEARLFQLLGGRDAMIESPLLQKLKAEWTREAAQQTRWRTLVDILVAPFGSKSEDVCAQLETIDDAIRLRELVKLAATCPDIKTFHEYLVS
ncbi:MAG: hypothetical protein ACP5XB_01730 [Isosphaeraceae bacterium]